MEILVNFLMIAFGLAVIGISVSISDQKKKRESLEKAHREAEWKKIVEGAREISKGHLHTLARKRRQLVRSDDYGVEDTTRWDQEIQYFIEKIVTPLAEHKGICGPGALDNEAARFLLSLEVEEIVDEHIRKRAVIDLDEVSSGEDYEIFCKLILEESGWDVRQTAATGDQGADLIAERQGTRAVFHDLLP